MASYDVHMFKLGLNFAIVKNSKFAMATLAMEYEFAMGKQ